MPSILIVCDDMMDDKMAMGGGILQQIFTRGRHFYCSCFLMTQNLRVIAHNQAAVRVNANALVMFRARNEKDVQAMIEETAHWPMLKHCERFTMRPRAKISFFIHRLDAGGTRQGLLQKLPVEAGARPCRSCRR